MQHNGFNTLANYPHAFGGDKVYAFEINNELSNVGSFDGDARDLFIDFQEAQISPAGATNPKTITLKFEGPVESSVIGFGSEDGSLSNGKLILKGIDGQVLNEVDQSTDSTPRGVLFFAFEQTTFIEVVLELHTDNEVKINGAWIPKSNRVAVAAIDGLIPTSGQSTTELIADDEWISGIIDTKNYAWIIASAHSDVASGINGFVIEFSMDKVNWFWAAQYTVKAGGAKTYSEQPVAQYLRVRYKNGATLQGVFGMTVQLKPTASKASSHKINDEIDGEDDAELVKAVNTAFSLLTGLSENITSFRGAMQVDQALVHKVGINEFFHRVTAVTTTLATAVVALEYIIDVVSSVGINIGDKIQIPTTRPNGELFFTVTDINANLLTLDMPVPIAVLIGTAVEVIVTNMAVDGTLASPVLYTISPPVGALWQLTRAIPVFADNTAMDDGLFAGIASLTNGIVLRSYIDGVYENITNWKKNGDLALDMFDVEYTSKAPAGENGLRGRWTVTKSEFVIELNGDNNDRIDALVQDPVSAVTSVEIKAQGRLFGG